MKTLRRLSIVCLVGYTALLTYWMIFGFGRRYTYSTFRYNLKPFETINHFMQIDRFNPDVWIVNLLGNIGVFMPFGILLPLVLGGKLKKPFMIFFAGVLALELLQLFTRRGSFDVDDLLLNSVGFLLGFALFKGLEKIHIKMLKSRELEVSKVE